MNRDDDCKKCKEEERQSHTCPFAEEINGDTESLCTCCSECESECRYDI